MKVHFVTVTFTCASFLWADAFNLPNLVTKYTPSKSPSTLFPCQLGRPLSGTISASAAAIVTESQRNENNLKSALIQGGRLSFSTKYGALNPFAIYYGLVAIILGIPWFAALTACQFLYFITGGRRVDKMRRLPIFFSHLWGVILGKLTNTIPKFEGREILDTFYKE